MKSLLKILLTAIAVIIIANILPGSYITDYWTAICVALAIGCLNLTIKPLLIFFTLPATIMSLGLFLFVINALIILTTDYFVDGFSVDGFWTALIFSICLSILKWILSKFIEENEKG